MNDGQRRGLGHDSSMRIAPAVAKHGDVARDWTGPLAATVEDEPKVPLFSAM